MTILDKFSRFMKNITESDRVAIYAGPDVDGLSSAAITSEAIYRIRKKPIDLFMYEETNRPQLSAMNKKLIFDKKINKLVVLDISIDNAPIETIEVLASIDTLVLDHHTTTQDLNNRGIVFVKPEYFSKVEPARYPTSKLSYDLLSKVVDLSDMDWISCLGILSDSSYLSWKDFVDKTLDTRHISPKNPEEVWNSPLGWAVTTLNRALLYDVHNARECLKTISNCSGPEELVNSDIKRYKKEIDVEINRLMGDFKKMSEVHHSGRTTYYEFSSPFSVCSTLSTIASYKFMQDSSNLVVVQPIKDKCIINLRRNDKKVDLAEIAKLSVQGFADSSGGGHIPAAGAEIRKVDLPAYKKRLLDLIESKDR